MDLRSRNIDQLRTGAFDVATVGGGINGAVSAAALAARGAKVELLVSQERLRRSAGLFEACKKLFGPAARTRFNDYFSQQEGVKRPG